MLGPILEIIGLILAMFGSILAQLGLQTRTSSILSLFTMFWAEQVLWKCWQVLASAGKCWHMLAGAGRSGGMARRSVKNYFALRASRRPHLGPSVFEYVGNSGNGFGGEQGSRIGAERHPGLHIRPSHRQNARQFFPGPLIGHSSNTYTYINSPGLWPRACSEPV